MISLKLNINEGFISKNGNIFVLNYGTRAAAQIGKFLYEEACCFLSRKKLIWESCYASYSEG